jgi:hypothetical protein
MNIFLMDPNCKPVHAHGYYNPRSVEQQLQHSKVIVRLLGIGVLEEDPEYSYEWAFISPSFAIPKKDGTIKVVNDLGKLNLLLKRRISPISYSKDWGHDPFNRIVQIFFAIGLRFGLLSHQTIFLL